MLLVHRHPSRRRYPGRWDLVGGHVESGELPHQAVSRECVEELRVRVHNPVPIPMTVTRGERARSEDVVRRLVTTGYQVRVLDNLSTGSAVHLAS